MEKFTGPAVKQNLSSAMKFVVETAKKYSEISKKTENELRIITEEIVMNITSYAYGDENGDMFIDCDYDEESRKMSISFSDCGIAYNPLEHKDPDITLGIMERSIGGLGVFMVKNLSDDISYERKNDMNVLTVVKTV